MNILQISLENIVNRKNQIFRNDLIFLQKVFHSIVTLQGTSTSWMMIFFSKSAPENMIYSQKNVSLRPSGLTLHNLWDAHVIFM